MVQVTVIFGWARHDLFRNIIRNRFVLLFISKRVGKGVLKSACLCVVKVLMQPRRIFLDEEIQWEIAVLLPEAIIENKVEVCDVSMKH